MPDFLLDTNHLSAAVMPVSHLREIIRERYRAGWRFGTSWSVLCELEAGLVNAKHAAKLRRMLDSLLTVVRIWPFDWNIVGRYGSVSILCRARGVVLSFVDMELAARALESNLTLLTADKDFEAFPEIRCENWLDGSNP